MSPRRRRLVLPEGTTVGPEVRLAGQPHRYLFRVLRLTVGDAVELVEPPHAVHHAVVVRITREHALLRVEASERCAVAQKCQITLLHGLSRKQRSDWVVQKATELGADRVGSVVCARSVRNPADGQRLLDRWQRIAREAARQCGRTDLPRLLPLVALDDALTRVGERSESSADACCLVASEGAPPPTALAVDWSHPPRQLVLLVGPEGGLSPAEQLIVERAGFLPVGLGPYTQRTETAALSLLATVSLLAGRWDPAGNDSCLSQ